ncbi:ThiF family adenylyltransferase [Nonomuraea sp. GTA35]|uniref:ThiF family adenylyltransferase n=1 Tax=Nonomuraea sp. GTA35 TaxID=1676746 RepID=UPI0035C1F0B4
MRPRVKPTLRHILRDERTLQLGTHPLRAVMLSGLTQPVREWVEGLDGTRDLETVLREAALAGLDEFRARSLLDQLAAQGALHDAATGPGSLRDLPLAERDRLRPELNALDLGSTAPDGMIALFERRRRSRVRVYGAGRIGAQVVALLAAAGVGHIRVLDPDETRPQDITPGGLTWAEVGMPREAGAVAVARRLTSAGLPPLETDEPTAAEYREALDAAGVLPDPLPNPTDGPDTPGSPRTSTPLRPTRTTGRPSTRATGTATTSATPPRPTALPRATGGDARTSTPPRRDASSGTSTAPGSAGTGTSTPSREAGTGASSSPQAATSPRPQSTGTAPPPSARTGTPPQNAGGASSAQPAALAARPGTGATSPRSARTASTQNARTASAQSARTASTQSARTLAPPRDTSGTRPASPSRHAGRGVPSSAQSAEQRGERERGGVEERCRPTVKAVAGGSFLGDKSDRPDLVILAPVGPLDMLLVNDLDSLRIPHLLASAFEGHGTVGPLVLPGDTACLHCLDLTRRDRDPYWPIVTARLGGYPPGEIACDVALATVVAAQVVGHALAFLDGKEPAVTNGTMDVTPDWRWKRRSWKAHPQCRCMRNNPYSLRMVMAPDRD